MCYKRFLIDHPFYVHIFYIQFLINTENFDQIIDPTNNFFHLEKSHWPFLDVQDP